MNLTARHVAQKPAKRVSDPAYMARVAALGCIVCEAFGEPQISPTQVHHCIHGRFGTRRAGDHDTIPICEGHHQGNFDTSKLALHRTPAAWKRAYGPDHSYVGAVRARLGLLSVGIPG
jgi:Recombination enhancement, RecA-dependent nuclease